jgi:hypothetical protein
MVQFFDLLLANQVNILKGKGTGCNYFVTLHFIIC